MEEESVSQFRRSKVEIYAHFVWTVKLRAPRLTPTFERDIHRAISAKAEELGCRVLAVGGMPDHVHVLVRLPGMVSAADFARIVKSSSSAMFNDLRPEYSEKFHWQDGYGCFSLWRTQVAKVTEYVNSQKERHASNCLWAEMEEFDEPAPNIKKL